MGLKHLLLIVTVVCGYLATESPVSKEEATRDIVLTPAVRCSFFKMDMGILLREGDNYTDGCDFYECVEGELRKDIHYCEKPIGDYEHGLCRQWSDDGCCCEVKGCEDVHGIIQDVGSLYMMEESPDPDRPECGMMCNCTSGPRVCMLNSDCFPTPDAE